MLNTIIKHIIYETCISVLFEQIQCNFADVKLEEIKIGMLKVHLGDMTFNLRRPIGTIIHTRTQYHRNIIDRYGVNKEMANAC